MKAKKRPDARSRVLSLLGDNLDLSHGQQLQTAAAAYTSLEVVRDVLRELKTGRMREDELLKVHTLRGEG